MGMKCIVGKRRWSVFVLLSLFLLASCGAGKPTLVAKKYFTALEDGDWEEAKNYVAVSSFRLFEEWRPYLQAGNTYKVQGYKLIDEDHAVVTYLENQDPTPKQLQLKKERGRWRVQLGDK